MVLSSSQSRELQKGRRTPTPTTINTCRRSTAICEGRAVNSLVFLILGEPGPHRIRGRTAENTTGAYRDEWNSDFTEAEQREAGLPAKFTGPRPQRCGG